ncbi:MAG: 50S ribosomal protein L11 methyltransferase [Muribaculaceae bacterium]|nr:50S ribosomal protein L11 methyltransferase [Muribaculaceae bacterium]
MNDYYEVRFDLQPCSEDACDLLAGMLAENDFESFVSDETGLTAYVKKEDYSEEAVKSVLADFPFECMIVSSAELIEGQDWNAEWEKNYFQPIVIGDRVVVHSSFHTDIPAAQYDIVIDPKMAFGTVRTANLYTSWPFMLV